MSFPSFFVFLSQYFVFFENIVYNKKVWNASHLIIYRKTSTNERLIMTNALKSDGAVFAGKVFFWCEYLFVLNNQHFSVVFLAIIDSRMATHVCYFYSLVSTVCRQSHIYDDYVNKRIIRQVLLSMFSSTEERIIWNKISYFPCITGQKWKIKCPSAKHCAVPSSNQIFSG